MKKKTEPKKKQIKIKSVREDKRKAKTGKPRRLIMQTGY